MADSFTILNSQYGPSLGTPTIINDSLFFSPTTSINISGGPGGTTDIISETVIFDIQINSGLQLTSISVQSIGSFTITGVGSSARIDSNIQITENTGDLRSFNDTMTTIPISPIEVTSGNLSGQINGDISSNISTGLPYSATNLHISFTFTLSGLAIEGGTTDLLTTFVFISFAFGPIKFRPNPTKKNISIIQSKSDLSIEKYKHTLISSSGINNKVVLNHLITQYQIYENHIPLSGKPLINLRSNSDIKRNGNLVSLTRKSLKIILTSNTKYKIRMRFKGSTSGWSKWTRLVSFKTRNKDYKYKGK